jgi:hypothetical protein
VQELWHNVSQTVFCTNRTGAEFLKHLLDDDNKDERYRIGQPGAPGHLPASRSIHKMKKHIRTLLLRSLLALCGASLTAADAPPVFPLKISENRRHLVDQQGTPFLYQADTPWILFIKPTESEAKENITRRREQGFTALQVTLTGFLGMTNRAGELPFAGTPPEQDFAKPNQKFFAHVDRVVGEAQRQGMLLAIAPAWSGCCGEGWAGQEKDGSPKPMNRNGTEKSRELGRWLGQRYGKFSNVMWILGGDIDPDNARAEIRALGLGLKDTAPKRRRRIRAPTSGLRASHGSTCPWFIPISVVSTKHGTKISRTFTK